VITAAVTATSVAMAFFMMGSFFVDMILDETRSRIDAKVPDRSRNSGQVFSAGSRDSQWQYGLSYFLAGIDSALKS
jgi:hypothetical protein